MRAINDSIDAQHIYQLEGFNTLRFLKKVDGQLVYEGTTNEEVIEVLIHRISALNDQFPCRENVDAIAHLGMALKRLNDRTAKRVQQGVEGQDINHV